jgi:hypothetical protein
MFFARPWDTTAAFTELGRAIASDSSYNMPFLMRAYVLDVKGRWEDLAQLIERLEPRRAKMNREEREAMALYEADLRGDLLGRLRASRAMADLRPGSSDMALLVAVSASYINRADEAHKSLLKTKTDRGINQVSPMYWAWRAASEHALGRFDDELNSAAQEVKSFPQSATAPLAFARGYAAKGNMTSLNTLLERAGLGSSRASTEAVNLALLASRELRAHGHEADARGLFKRVAAIPLAPNRSGADVALHALALYEVGNYRDAQALFASLAAHDSNDLDLLGRLGTAALRAGDTATARAVQAKLTSWPNRFAFGGNSYWLAHMAAVSGRGEEAVALLHQAIAAGYRPMDLGTITLHEEGDFAPLWKTSTFNDLVRPRDGPASLP